MEETTSTRPAVQAAAEWWASRLRPETPLRFDNGDQSMAGGIGMLLMIRNAQTLGHPPAEAVDAFRDALARDLDSLLASRGRVYLGVDYGPDGYLIKPLEEAGIRQFSELLPWKTAMIVSNDTVELAMGYAAPFATIYPASGAGVGEAGDA